MADRPRAPRPLEKTAVENVLDALAQRSDELSVGLARLNARVTQLEEMLAALRADCAELMRSAEKTAAARRPARARRRAPLRLLAGHGAEPHADGLNGEASTPSGPVPLIA
jgi:hypothetical protein